MVAGVRESIEETLQFALDLCIGTGAFFITPAGEVHSVVSDAMPPDDGHRRMDVLARSCLAHPSAHGHELFWNSEVTTGPLANDFSLACVVTPVWAGNTPLGLLGVADNWLPEPDAEQEAGLLALARKLSRLLPCSTASGLTGNWTPGSPAAVGATPGSLGHPAGDSSASGPGGPSADRADEADGQELSMSDLDARKQAYEEDLAPFFERLLDQLPDALVMTTTDGTIVLVNRHLLSMTGRSADELLGKDVSAIFLAGSPVRSGQDRGGPAAEQPLAGRYQLIDRGGAGLAEVEARSERITTPFAGDCVVTLIRPASSVDPRETPTGIMDLIENLDDGIMFLGTTGEVLLANHAANTLHGLPEGHSLIGSQLPEVTALRTEDGHIVAHDQHPGLKVLSDGLPITARMTLGDANEGQRYITVVARPGKVAGQAGALVVMHDTTEMWLEQQRLTHYALHDPLTNLANRYLLLEELRRMLQGLARRGGSVALVFIDLDNFKRINDEHGHDVGDEALSAVARRLLGTVRAEDVVARLGGDEFVIAHASAERVPDGDLVVARVRKVLSAPFRLRGQAFDLGASIGWVSTDSSEIGPDEMLAQADRAMYRHKRDRSGIRSRAV